MKKDTQIAHAGRCPEKHYGVVNTPAYRCSTFTYKTVADMEDAHNNKYDKVYYGRFGTPTTYDLEDAVTAVGGGYRTIAVSSGLAAITGTMSALLECGDHVLVVDSVYGPTRDFCDVVLKKFGVETTYYNPVIGAGISELIKDNTKVIFCESPGSQTFEIQDIPAISKAAHEKGAVVIMDNTWGSPLNFSAFDKGVDVSIQAATKYIVGHSDALLGTITTTKELYEKLRFSISTFGYSVGSEEAYLGARGIRTIGVRLKQHEKNAMKVAKWLQSRPEVSEVLCPALPDDKGHEIWKRDFTGACGLFGVVLKPCSDEAIAKMIDGYKLFSIGLSWGGFESLVLWVKHITRTVTTVPKGSLLRFHIGLEDADDLIDDLEKGFKRLAE